MLAKFSSLSTPVDPDTFLQHYWLSKESYVSKAGLFKEMKGKIKSANAAAWLRDLTDAAVTYSTISGPLEARWANEQIPLRDSLAAMTIFRVAQATPLVLAIMRLYESNTISLSSTKRVLAQIEKFTYQFNAITQSRGGGGIANMHSRLAQSVSQCDDSQQFAQIHKEINKKLFARVPDFDEFLVGFSRLQFNAGYTRDRALVRYTLRKISEHFGLSHEINPATYTIEHIKPDSEYKTISEWVEIGSIGNLLFVPDSVNQKLGVRNIQDKVAILKSENVPADPGLLGSPSHWSSAEITSRTKYLAEISYNSIWKLSN